MKHGIQVAAAATAITVASLFGSTAPARAYQVDCAILLCLAGGWPASAPCAHARAVFIRRITPWPVEPPLQIWNCPMGASLDGPSPLLPMERFHNIQAQTGPALGVLRPLRSLTPAQSGDRADVDISGAAFDFVRSIRVYHVQFSQYVNASGDCITHDATRLGAYGAQGDYRWTQSSVSDVPSASALPRIDPESCSWLNYRAVFVDWRDHAGTYGYEEVRY